MRAETLSLNTEVEAFLTEAQLPVADLTSRRSLDLLGFRDRGRLVGVVGIEVYGSIDLLRSLAVAPAHRNSGLGGNLVSNAEAWAAKQGVQNPVPSHHNGCTVLCQARLRGGSKVRSSSRHCGYGPVFGSVSGFVHCHAQSVGYA